MMFGHGYGPGMAFGYGWGFGRAALQLTPQQRQRLYEIQAKSARKYWMLFGQMQEEHIQIARLLASNNPDQKAVNEAYDKLSQTGKALLDLRMQNHRAALQVLTDEQRKMLDQPTP
jgi:Spy/CpxP family protein refolding chaperone